jgi:hypothetical protein
MSFEHRENDFGEGAIASPPPIVFRFAQSDCPLPQGEGDIHFVATAGAVTASSLDNSCWIASDEA